MRLDFPNGEHPEFVVNAAVVTLGSAAGNTLVLADSGVAPWHARVSADQRGLVLEILDPAARSHVNARPVREKALLRLGDVVNLNTVTMLIKPDFDDDAGVTIPAEGTATTSATACPVVLRAVSGMHFGKCIPVNGRLVIGRDRSCGLQLDEPYIALRHAAVEHIGDAVYLRDLGAPHGIWVNGVKRSGAMLQAGDQIAFERSRFVVEAPGLPRKPVADVLLPDDAAHGAADAPPAETDPASGPVAIWWLIGAAALIGLGLAALLLVH